MKRLFKKPILIIAVLGLFMISARTFSSLYLRDASVTNGARLGLNVDITQDPTYQLHTLGRTHIKWYANDTTRTDTSHVLLTDSSATFGVTNNTIQLTNSGYYYQGNLYNEDTVVTAEGDTVAVLARPL